MGALVALLVGLMFFFNRDNPTRAGVGACVAEDGDELNTVDCGSSEARYRVVGTPELGEGQSGREGMNTACARLPTAVVSYYEGTGEPTQGKKVVCAEPITR